MSGSQLEQLRDELFMVTGAAVAQLQLLEYYISGCMAFVWKNKAHKIMANILSSDPKRRGDALGPMVSELRKRISLQPDFDTRLSDFVENRNRLIHRLFQDLARCGAPPPQDELMKAKQFISALIQETLELQKIFLGFYSAIGKKLKESDNDNRLSLDSELVDYLAKYENHFFSAFGVGGKEPDGV